MIIYIYLHIGLRHKDTISSIHNLAVLYESFNKIEEARELFEEIVNIGKEINSESIDTVSSLVRLGKSIHLV
jgi:predicted Zn-dependent protease